MNKKGFTLVEIIAIVAILAILVIIAAPNVMKLFREGREKTMTIQENEVLDAAKLYLEDYCRNPISSSYLKECNDNRYELFLFGDVNTGKTERAHFLQYVVADRFRFGDHAVRIAQSDHRTFKIADGGIVDLVVEQHYFFRKGFS